MKAEDENAAELALLGRALRNLRERKNISQTAAGAGVEPAKMTSQAWGLHENGHVKGLLTPGVQTKLTAAIGHTKEDLLSERDRLAQGEDAPAPSAEIRQFQPAANRRQAVFPLSEGGEVVIQFPQHLSPQARREMADFLSVLVKNARESESD